MSRTSFGHVLIISVIIAVLLAACGGSATGDANIGPELAAQQSFETWAETLSIAYRNDDYETVSENGGFASVRVTVEFQRSADAPWEEQEATVDVVRRGEDWDAPLDFAFGPTTEAIQTADASRNATASVQAVVDQATAGAQKIADDATASVETANAGATAVADNATATAQTIASNATATADTIAANATATARSEEAEASATASIVARLEHLYGQMESSAQASEWTSAFSTADEILREDPDFRDIRTKRTTYAETIYTRAVEASNQGDWPQAVGLLRVLAKAAPDFKDVNERLDAAELAVKTASPGVYIMEIAFTGDMGYYSDLPGELARIEVLDDGRIKVVARFWNNTRGSEGIGPCSEMRPSLILTDGTRINALETECVNGSANGGSLQTVPSGGSIEDAAIFPPLADATQSFSVDWVWHSGPQTLFSDIVLVSVPDF